MPLLYDTRVKTGGRGLAVHSSIDDGPIVAINEVRFIKDLRERSQLRISKELSTSALFHDGNRFGNVTN